MPRQKMAQRLQGPVSGAAAPPRTLDRPAPGVEEPTEDERQQEFVYRLLARSLSRGEIARACRAQFGIGQTRVDGLVRRCLEVLRDRAEGNRPFSKGEQIARVRGVLSELLTPRFEPSTFVQNPDGTRTEVQGRQKPVQAAQVARLEELLADLEGNREPVKVDVSARLQGAAAVVFAGMTPERFEGLVLRARERKRLAAASGIPEVEG